MILLLLVFGAKRLPEMGRSLGSGMRGFKDTLSGEATHTPLVAAQEPAAPVAVPAAATVGEPVIATPVRETTGVPVA